jgi:hypothetical protein
VVQVYLHRGVPNDEVSADDVTSDLRRHEETIGISQDRVLFDDVVIGAGLLQANAKVDRGPLGITIST